MLIRSRDLERIVEGEVTLAFRRWRRPTVKSGGTLRTAKGVLAIHEVVRIDEREIEDAEARAAGFATRSELLAQLDRRSGDVYRIRLSFAGADPRVALRRRATLTDDERVEIARRLERLDATSPRGPWSANVLRLIEDRPATRAPDLAAAAGFEVRWFKTRVRRLKELGLTESLGTGYRLSPRGRAFLAAKESPDRG